MLTPNSALLKDADEGIEVADIIRASIHGTMPSGEVWSINPTFVVNAHSAVTGSELIAAAVVICGSTLPTGLRNVMSDRVSWTGVILEARTFSGTLEARGEALRGAPVAGLTQPKLPFQSAMVASMQTIVPGGRGRGRLYWPALDVTLDPTTLRIPTATITAFLAGMETFMRTIEGALDAEVDGGTTLAVWSRASSSAAHVTKWRGGDVLDTQRRRRDAIPETYSELAHVPV